MWKRVVTPDHITLLLALALLPMRTSSEPYLPWGGLQFLNVTVVFSILLWLIPSQKRPKRLFKFVSYIHTTVKISQYAYHTIPPSYEN